MVGISLVRAGLGEKILKEEFGITKVIFGMSLRASMQLGLSLH